LQILWIFQETAFVEVEVIQRLIYAVQEIGDEVRILKYVPFEIENQFKDIPEKPVIVHGSIVFIKRAQKEIANAPAVWADWSKLCCSEYYTRYPTKLTQENWVMLPWGSLLDRQDFLYKTLGCNDKVFIRPDYNTKRFTGQLVDKTQLMSFCQYYKDECDNNDIIIVATPVEITREWRLVMYNDEVVTSSQYKENNYLVISTGCPARVKTFASACCKEWRPHNFFVIDIAEVNNKYSILEIGSFNCAGLYGCDVHKVAVAAHKMAEIEYVEENVI
jgi:ATP-grasp domain, R2K clade family 2